MQEMLNKISYELGISTDKVEKNIGRVAYGGFEARVDSRKSVIQLFLILASLKTPKSRIVEIMDRDKLNKWIEHLNMEDQAKDFIDYWPFE